MDSLHGRRRCQQRAIGEDIIEVLLSYGEHRRRNGADVYYFSRNSRARAVRLGRDRYRRMERGLNTYLVIGDDGTPITATRRLKHLKFD